VKDSERETSLKRVRNEHARAARASPQYTSECYVVRPRLYYSLYVVANYIQAVSANYMIRRSLCDPRCVSGGAGRVPTTTGCARRVTRPTEAGGASRRGGTAAGTVALDVPERLDLDLRPW